MQPRDYRPASSRWAPPISAVQITEEGVVGPTWWGRCETLRWEEIKDVQFDWWDAASDSLGYHLNILPKVEGKRKVLVHVKLEQVGEAINIIKEKSGLLPAIRDLDRFLTEPRLYGYDPTWVSMTVAGYAVLGLLMAAPLPFLWECLARGILGRQAVWMGIVGILFCLSWMVLVPLWRSLRWVGVRLRVDAGGLNQYRGTRVMQRIAWSELGKINMLWDRSVLTARGGRCLTVFQNLPRFDELNQIIRLQKERLRL